MKKIGLKVRVISLCIIFTILLAGSLGYLGFRLYKNGLNEKYCRYADALIGMTDYQLAKYDMPKMIRDQSMGPDYYAVGDTLNDMKEKTNVAYIFVIYFDDLDDLYSIHYATYGSTAEQLATDVNEPAFMGKPAGEGDFDEGMRIAYRDAIRNKEQGLCSYDNNTDKYGHIITYFRVFYDKQDNPVGIISIDIDVKEIQAALHQYLMWVFIIAFVLMMVFVSAFAGAVSRFMTDPVIRIAESTTGFVKQLEEAAAPEELTFADPKVHSYDELGMLSRNVTKMSETVKDYMQNLQSVTAEKERIGAELNVATQIQADMLPRIFPAFPDREEFDIYATMTPAKEVGGDFYDFFLMDEHHIVLVMADVSGKGVPAALFMVIAKTLIKNRAQMGGTPSEILADVNEQLCDGNDMSLFVTAWLAVIDLRTGKGLAANAGHEHPALYHAGGKWELVVYRHSIALAAMEGVRFREHTFELQPGDSLFVYTDGVPEATDTHNMLYGTDRMLDALNREPGASPDRLLRNVKADIDLFIGGAPQFDDITMLGFTWQGKR
ncbi:MAG: PP2C family protein-serine/threonine phosphatase [Lachnospiraceae bacterium]|nr:PP2C family protein-serine/threonine phosphatase [Lachnospiraceae bacterium]